ncbi:MAG TPA: hypothetical protein VK963_03950 [Candidatus Saccharimonadales bacterium]|nr:hypothetical protein [Candidatus Saccharimonadales bacterium]
MFYLACRYTYEATKAAVVILVLAVIAYSYHTEVDRTRFAELVALAEVEPIREPMALRPGADRTRLTELLSAAELEP